MDISTLILTLILATQAGSLWVLVKLLRKPVAEVPVTVKLEPKPDSPKSTCYFCNNQFPVEEVEKIGTYTYCKEHGSRRQVS